MSKTIFDSVSPRAFVAYTENKPQQKPPFYFETLFGTEKQLGLDISYLIDSAADAKLLQVHAWDSKTNKMDRKGFDEMNIEAFLMKNEKTIGEKLRQQLLTMEQTGDKVKINTVKNNIFNDQETLIEAARRAREFHRAQVVSTGVLTISQNGQIISIDYGMPTDNKATSTTEWDDISADIIGDITDLQDVIEENTGERPEKAVTSRKVLKNIMKNTAIINALKNAQILVNDKNVINYIYDVTNVKLIVYNKKYESDAGVSTRYIPEDLFILLPEGELGKTVFGTTPEEADLTSGLNADVSITDVGVAVTKVEKTDPVTTGIKVSQVCVPAVPTIEKIGVLDTQITL